MNNSHAILTSVRRRLRLLLRTLAPFGVVLFLAGSQAPIYGAACNATATGNWSDGTRWTGCTGPGGTPAAGDTITINSAVVITLNVNATVGGITFAAPGTNNGINHSTNAL